MKEINLYLENEIIQEDYRQINFEKSNIFRTIKVNDDYDPWSQPLKIDNKFYSVCISNGKLNYVIQLMKYYHYDEDLEDLETIEEEGIKCPVCEYIEGDCFEYKDDECDNHICSNCGSTLSWEREYRVDYITNVEKINEFKEI